MVNERVTAFNDIELGIGQSNIIEYIFRRIVTMEIALFN